MKNASIFLIIVASAAMYVFLRPYGTDEAGAQVIKIICARPNLPQIVAEMCAGRKNPTQLFIPAAVPTGVFTGASAGTTPPNTITTLNPNKGIFVTTPPPAAPTAMNPTAAMMSQYKGIFIDANGNTIRMAPSTPYGGPTYSSQMCSNGRVMPCPRDGRVCNIHTACGE